MKQTTFILIIFIAIFFVGCMETKNENITKKDEKITVIATLFPLYDFAKQIGGENVEVTLLLPAGTDPHFFEPKPSDIKKIENADVFIYIGQIMEPWAQDILEGLKNKDIEIIDASSLVTLLESNHQHYEEDEEQRFDPHIWLDLENDQKIVSKIAKVFSLIDYNNSQIYESNLKEYINQLKSLDQKYQNKLSSCKHNKFLIGGHNFFGYLEHRYNIEGISIIENLEPESEPTPKRIKEINDIVKDNGINYILTEVLVNKKMAEAIALESKSQLLIFNPASNIPKTDFNKNISFISIMENNLETLKIAGECN